MSQKESLDQALVLLEETLLESDRPTLVAASPESPSYLRGNRGGFIRLAIASLRAAQGEKQDFRRQSWVRCEDYDWVAGGLEYDEGAYTYLAPDSLTIPWWKKKLNNALGLLVFALVVMFLVVGIFSVVKFAIARF